MAGATAFPASAIISGVLDAARLGSGTADATSLLFGGWRPKEDAEWCAKVHKNEIAEQERLLRLANIANEDAAERYAKELTKL